jgi:hypothetical protein
MKSRRAAMRYRVDEWVDDDARGSGKNIFTVYEVSPDGSEAEILETRDRNEVENLVEGAECEWAER